MASPTPAGPQGIVIDFFANDIFPESIVFFTFDRVEAQTRVRFSNAKETNTSNTDPGGAWR
jgi:hypothetical protein